MLNDKYELSKLANELRSKLGEDNSSPVDIFRLAQTIDQLTLVFYPMGERISGMCLKGTDDIIVAINSSMTYGRQRFSMAHEFYHYFYDDSPSTICVKNIGETNEIERNANFFASFFLAPPAALSIAIKKIIKSQGAMDIAGVIKLEQFFGMSRQAMLIRLMDEGVLTLQDTTVMRSGIISQALTLGFDDSLYRPSSENKARMTYGRYIKQAKSLLNKGIISEGKFDELLLDAFRTDLVFGVNNEGEIVD